MPDVDQVVEIPAGRASLEGSLVVPPRASGVVLFAHGSGSSRHSARNQFVARRLQATGLATLLIDLLTTEEEAVDSLTRHVRFDIELLASRLNEAILWLGQRTETSSLRVGLFGASTGGGAALVAAAREPDRGGALGSRGGRPALAGEALPHGRAPTQLLVGGDDVPVIALNERAMALMPHEVRLEVVPGASHLFEEPGTLERVAELASGWFAGYL